MTSPKDLGDLRRPLLAKGERLRIEAERYGGGGSKFHPRSNDEAFQHLAPQASALVGALRQLEQSHSGRHVVIEATILPNYLAASYFPQKTIDGSTLYIVGAKPDVGPHFTKEKSEPTAPTKTYFIAGAPAAVMRFASGVSLGPGHSTLDWDEIRRFENLKIPDPNRVVRGVPIDMPMEQVITWEAVLTRIGRTDAERDRWNDETFEKFVALVRSVDGDVDMKYRRAVGGVIFVPVRLSLESTRRVARMNVLRALRPMPKIRPLPSSPLRAQAHTKPTVSKDRTPRVPGRVAVFDGGIPDSPVFRGSVHEIDLTSEAKTSEFVSHGASVTTAVMYGPLDPKTPIENPLIEVDHYRVFPAPASEGFDDELVWLLDRISEHAPKYPVVNLSIGPDISVTEQDDAPHIWTTTLDQLAHKCGVTFVVAAGNNGEEDSELGYNRVLTPADMVNGLGIGACDCAVSPKIVATDYSARGPGRDGQRIQPIGVQFGGTAKNPFVGIDDRGRFVQVEGTSFSAPTVAGGLAELRHLLTSAHSRAETLRAFAAHFATQNKRGHRLAEVGFGRIPRSYLGHMECLPEECHILYEDSLPREGSVAFELPVPRLQIDTEVVVRWTICYTSDTDTANAAEYTLDGLELFYRPNEFHRVVTNAATREILGKFDLRNDAAKIDELRKAFVIEISDAPIADPRWSKRRPETVQKMAGKWETVMQGRIPATAIGLLYRPRIDLNYLRREGGRLVDAAPLNVSILVSLTADAGANLYDEIGIQFPQLVPITIDVTST